MRFIKSKRGLFILLIFLLVPPLIVVISLFLTRTKQSIPVPQITAEQRFEELIDRLQVESAAREKQVLSTIKTFDEFKSLSEEDQNLFGTLLAGHHLDQGNVEFAQQLLDYLMTKNTSESVSASQMCFRTATTDERRAFCRDKAYEILKSQDMLEDSQIPTGFLEPLEEVN